MCGICGILGELDKHVLDRMSEVIKHRGPDDAGCFTDKGIGICNRRLSIIDLAGRHEPVHNEDSSIWVVFNGEIYNFMELREILEKAGHRFYTNSDMEVIIHSYEEWNLNCLQKFNGMFAVAIWDSKQKRLLIARDRTGIKPLYYTNVGDTFIFASEIKAIVQDDRVKIQPDFDAIHQYLNVRYFPSEKTPFLNIKKLLPGHFIEIKDGKRRTGSYWTLRPVKSEQSEEYYVAQLERILQSALKRHMISDVPIGFYLSGGVDSSSVVYFAEKNTKATLKTFCIGFDEDDDEFKDAQLVADELGTEHHNLVIRKSLLKDFPKMIWYADTPKRNLYPYYVAELARKHVKVVLTDLGADELFAGYNWKPRTMSPK